MSENRSEPNRDFIRDVVDDDLRTGKHGGRVATRFPPEPNGYLHIGHAKSICLNFGIAREYGGACHLRFDDTNPTTESVEYTESILRDVRWLGFDWGDHLYYASDYFERMHDLAVGLIRDRKAYVDSLSEEQIREYRGTVTEPGRDSPFRDRTVHENLELFARMRAGELPDGSCVLRARIDMAAKNMLMRDPLLYRIRHAHHYRTGDQWCIYPMYDYAHCLEDSFERITHSLCTLEFENNRELYDWVLDNADVACHPQQIEFARLNLTYTVMSKRKLLQLVEEGHVAGWDDPRMPTISGLRRRGYTPESIRAFCERIGVARTYNVIDVALLEFSVRDDLNQKVPRVLGVLRPLKVVIENYPEEGPEGAQEELEAPFYPHDVPLTGSRRLPFTRELYVERDDFDEDPPPGYYRLAPGREVRLRYAYLIRCTGVVKDDAGEVVELRCTYDPATRGGNAPDGRKVQGTLHWVSAAHAVEAEVRLYDRLFSHESPDAQGADFRQYLNPDSLAVLRGCRLEPSLADARPGDRFQLERQGYFVVDADARDGALVLNRTVTLRDSWAKVTGEGESEERKAAARRKAATKAEVKERQQERSRDARGEEPALTPEESARAARLRAEHGLSEQDARLLAVAPYLEELFAAAVAAGAGAQAAANWTTNEVRRELKEGARDRLPFGGGELAELIALLDAGTVSATLAKEVFAEMAASGGRPEEIVERRGLRQVDDAGALAPVVERVLTENPAQVAAYRGGKTALLGFFVGQVMKATGGRANPQLVNRLLGERLAGDDPTQP